MSYTLKNKVGSCPSILDPVRQSLRQSSEPRHRLYSTTCALSAGLNSSSLVTFEGVLAVSMFGRTLHSGVSALKLRVSFCIASFERLSSPSFFDSSSFIPPAVCSRISAFPGDSAL